MEIKRRNFLRKLSAISAGMLAVGASAYAACKEKAQELIFKFGPIKWKGGNEDFKYGEMSITIELPENADEKTQQAYKTLSEMTKG